MDDSVLKLNGYRARIEVDEDFDSEMLGDRMGKFYTGRKAAAHGFPADVELYENSGGITQFDSSEFLYCAPVYGFSHSGLAISLTPFSDPWDSAQIGYYAVSNSEAEAWFGKNYVRAQAEAQAEAEVAEICEVLRGHVYYVVIEKQSDCGAASHPDFELVDSIGGLVGYQHAFDEAHGLLQAAAQ